MTVAAFMDLALYHPDHGYYATRAPRSGREGDFYTSVDTGPFFGELLASQFAQMLALLGEPVDLVEAAAGGGQLMRDVLDALQREWPREYDAIRVHLVDRSGVARAGHAGKLGPHVARVATSSAQLPPRLHGILFANELLDALPVHVVVMTSHGPREIHVGVEGDRLVERVGPLSTPALRPFLELPGAPVAQGARAEIGLAAAEWVREAARRLDRGFVLLLDYGDEAAGLRGAMRPDGTLRAFRDHRVSPRWLEAPGEQDLTAHVDFTALERAAAAEGLDVLGRVDQARFLLGLGAIERLRAAETTLSPLVALRRRLAAKPLLVPGGVGSTHHALVFGKNMGRPALAGLSLARP